MEYKFFAREGVFYAVNSKGRCNVIFVGLQRPLFGLAYTLKPLDGYGNLNYNQIRNWNI